MRATHLGVAALLVLVTAAGAILRFWGLDAGLPFTMARPDEAEVLRHTVGFGVGDLNPRWFVYPNLFLYLVAAWEHTILAVRGLVMTTPPYPAMLRVNLPRIILYGRLLSVAVGTATIPLVYLVGRSVGGRALGLVAATLLAGNWLHARDSHALKTEPLLAAGICVALWALARWVREPVPRRAVIAGACIGVTTGFKYPGVFLMAPATLAGMGAARSAGRPGLLPHPQTLLVGVVAAVVFLLCCPFIVLDFARTLDTANFLGIALYATRPEATPGAGASWTEQLGTWLATRAFAYHLGVSLRYGCGLLVALATPIAIGVALGRGAHPFMRLAAAFMLFWYAIIGASPVQLARYFTPLTPILALVIAHLVVRLPAAAARPALRTALLAVVTLALVAEPVWSTVQADRIAAQADTRVLATTWMTANMPPDVKVLALGSAVAPIDPDVPPGVRREFAADPGRPLAAQGIRFVITHEHHQLPFSRVDPTLMATLAPELRLLATFSPWADGPAGAFEREDAYYIPFYDFAGVVRPGPLVRIYAVNAAP